MTQQQRPFGSLQGLSRAALNRRGFLGLAGAGVSAAALSACGGGPSTNASGGGSAAANAAEQIDFSGVTPAKEITFWSSHPGNSQQVTQQIINEFHKQSDIRVKLVTAGADYEEIAQKFQTAQQGGELPDLVVLSDVWWFRYMMNDQIIPMDSLFETLEYDTGDYVDALLADYDYREATWAVPWARSTPVFYYNKDHFRKAGLDPENPPATWQELAEAAPALKKASGAPYAFQLPALADYAGWTFQNNLWAWGGGWSAPDSFDITCDSEESVAAIQFLADAVKDGWAGVSSTEATQDLATGQVCSFTVSSTGTLGSTIEAVGNKFELGVGFLPGGPEAGGEGGDPVCPTGGSGVGIPKGIDPERQLAAGEFIKFLTSPEMSVRFSRATGYMPTRKSADTTSLVEAVPQIQTSIDQLEVTRPQDYARVFLPGGDMAMVEHCSRILNEGADVSTEMGNLRTALEKIYTEQVEPNPNV